MNEQKAIDFILNWVIGLPMKIADKSKYKAIRIIGFLIFMLWSIPILAICTPFILVLLLIDIIRVI